LASHVETWLFVAHMFKTTHVVHPNWLQPSHLIILKLGGQAHDENEGRKTC